MDSPTYSFSMHKKIYKYIMTDNLNHNQNELTPFKVIESKIALSNDDTTVNQYPFLYQLYLYEQNKKQELYLIRNISVKSSDEIFLLSKEKAFIKEGVSRKAFLPPTSIQYLSLHSIRELFTKELFKKINDQLLLSVEKNIVEVFLKKSTTSNHKILVEKEQDENNNDENNNNENNNDKNTNVTSKMFVTSMVQPLEENIRFFHIYPLGIENVTEQKEQNIHLLYENELYITHINIQKVKDNIYKVILPTQVEQATQKKHYLYYENGFYGYIDSNREDQYLILHIVPFQGNVYEVIETIKFKEIKDEPSPFTPSYEDIFEINQVDNSEIKKKKYSKKFHKDELETFLDTQIEDIKKKFEAFLKEKNNKISESMMNQLIGI